MSLLGLPDSVKACLFDLDGVLTQTAKMHAAAWTRMFDEFLQRRAKQRAEPFVAFDEVSDYEQYVDGKPRYDGVASFLHSRGIELEQGTEHDPPGAETIHGLGNRKNEIVLSMIKSGAVQAYQGSVEYVRAARAAGMSTAVVSSSSNAHAVLAAARIEDLFDVVIDGEVVECEHLHGKPAPDAYLAGARAVGAQPAGAAVFEDALAGVEAGRAGGFRAVVGVDRLGQADALRTHGADIVVADLSELLRAP